MKKILVQGAFKNHISTRQFQKQKPGFWAHNPGFGYYSISH